MLVIFRFLAHFAVKYTCETPYKYTCETPFMEYNALVIRGGKHMKKRKICQLQTHKEPPKDKHGKMSSALGEELCYQFAWGSYSPQKVQQLAQLAIQDMDVLGVASTGPSSATLLAGSSKSHSSATVISGTSRDHSSGTCKDHSSGTSKSHSSGTSSATSSATSKDPYIELRQLSAIGTCGKHSNNCHRDLMNILEMKSLMPISHKLTVAMSLSLSF